MRGMVVYYSYSGHTRQVAEVAARAAGWRLIELTVSPPYTGGYWKMVARVGSEMVTDNTSRTVIPRRRSSMMRIVSSWPCRLGGLLMLGPCIAGCRKRNGESVGCTVC